MPNKVNQPLSACIWCRVIDNFGDAGIAWRLARSLKREYGWNCRLVIDNLPTLAAFAPRVNPHRDRQLSDGIEVLNWTDAAAADVASHLPDIFIEAFSCFVPECCENAIGKAVAAGRKIAVYDLDYLTAEDYASTNQGLPSPHPRFGYPKTFWFPGFTSSSGGLLRERDLLQDIDAFTANDNRKVFLSFLGARPDAAFSLVFFTYPTNPIRALAQALATDPRPVQLLACAGEASRQMKECLSALRCPQVSVVDIPMLSQDDFDRLLWSADACLVRGEDSTLRAQWAGKPLLWTLYPQEGGTHLVKLAAFAKLYEKELVPEAARAWLAAEESLNNGQFTNADWSRWRDALPALQKGALAWRTALARQTTLTQRLTQNAIKQLK